MTTLDSFIEEMQKAGLKYGEPRDLPGGDVAVSCGIKGKYGAYEFVFVFYADEHSFSGHVPNLLSIPIDKRIQLVDLMNSLNATYRWVKFYDDGESYLRVQVDAIVNPETCGKIAVELLLRTMKIIDEVYPKFMKTVWGDA